MSGKLAAELQQTKPFVSLEEEALLNLERTREFLHQHMTEFFKRFELTGTQYNMLRILRGAGKPGITCSRAAERMVTADPDVTRLLDRLEARGLIARERAPGDRRVVLSRITPAGLELLRKIDKPLAALQQRRLGGLGRGRLAQLIEILESIRQE